jgi:hypothetical protein
MARTSAAKVAAKPVRKAVQPAAKTAAKAVKPVAKTVKAAVKTAVKAAVKPAAKPAVKAKAVARPAAPKAAPAARLAKTAARGLALPKGAKAQPRLEADTRPTLVRDSFTMPEQEYAVLGAVKQACLQAGFEIKKSELLRIGVALLGQLDTQSLRNVLDGLPQLKTGRPPAE